MEETQSQERLAKFGTQTHLGRGMLSADESRVEVQPKASTWTPAESKVMVMHIHTCSPTGTIATTNTLNI